MKELRENYLKKDEEKLIRAIHENYKTSRMKRQMNEQLKQFSKKESQFSKLESQKEKNILLKICLAITIITIIVLGFKYNENQVKSCMESGNSEMFCRYAGE